MARKIVKYKRPRIFIREEFIKGSCDPWIVEYDLKLDYNRNYTSLKL